MAEIAASYILEDIPFWPDIPALMKRLHIKPGSGAAAELENMLNSARELARPRALYLEAYVGERGDDWLVIGGERFTSRVLRVNLDQSYRVFPYLATCGPELQTWAAGFDDMVLNFWAEAIKEAALISAIRALDCRLEERYLPGQSARMNPGSLPDWPLEEQRVLFALFGPLAGQIGVELTDSLLMIPTKTVSGIWFATEVTFESCQLCERDGCPGRRAPYDPQLYAARYQAR